MILPKAWLEAKLLVGDPKFNLCGLTDRDFTGDLNPAVVATTAVLVTGLSLTSTVACGVASWATMFLDVAGLEWVRIDVGLVFGAVTPEVILE